MPENDAKPGEEKLLILPLGEESKKITQVISNDTARQIIELLADAPLSASDIAERLHAPISTIVYNLENLESVGLIRIEKIKYSEKGREVKIYAPVRKLIVVVPEKTDRKSVTDLLRKYIGVILAAILASGMIEFFTGSMGRSAKIMRISDMAAPTPVLVQNATSIPSALVNETVRGMESYGETAATPAVTPVSTVMTKSIPTAVAPAPTVGIQYANPAAATPQAPAGVWNASAASSPAPMMDGGAVSNVAPDLVTKIGESISAHPGITFFLGSLFIVVLLMILDYLRRRKNSGRLQNVDK